MPAEAAVAVSDVEVGTIGKLRRRIIPLLVLLYVVAYVDRINIGFAALTMNAALGITSAQFGLLAGIFFWGYFIFEVPSNLLLHRVGARMWIGRILVTWGIVAMAAGAVQNVQQFYVARFLLGVAEAGFFPGIILYLTYWFRQRDQAHVISLFVTALPVASILGAPVSGFILDHAHWAGLSSWRWLLILEALPAIVCGVLTCFLLPSRPAEARFLAKEEKSWLIAELAREEHAKTTGHSISALRALAHPRVWHLAAVLFGFDIGLYAMSFYMPQVVKALSNGFSNTVVGVLDYGSPPGRVGGDGSRIPQFRPKIGTEIPQRDPDRRGRNSPGLAGRDEFPNTVHRALVICCYGNLQLLRPVFLDTRQVPFGILGRGRHRFDQLGRESWWFCRTISHRSHR